MKLRRFKKKKKKNLEVGLHTSEVGCITLLTSALITNQVQGVLIGYHTLGTRLYYVKKLEMHSAIKKMHGMPRNNPALI